MISERGELMATLYQDKRRGARGYPGKVTVSFVNPDHLMDCLLFVGRKEQTAAFWEAIGRVTRMFVTDATYSGDGIYKSTAEPTSHDIVVEFRPDSPIRPSFIWYGTRTPSRAGEKPINLLHGGLIYRDAEGWTIHT